MSIEDLKKIPKKADILPEDCIILASTEGYEEASLQLDENYHLHVETNNDYQCAIGCPVEDKDKLPSDRTYYMFETNGLTGENAVREVAFYNKYGDVMNFEYTPDDLHHWWVSLNKDKISRPDVEELYVSQVKDGMSCIYRGIELTVVDKEHINISYGDKERTIKVEENDEFTYKFMKTKIKAKNGAYGYFAFMEKIAEQGKVEAYPLFSASYLKQIELLENSREKSR